MRIRILKFLFLFSLFLFFIFTSAQTIDRSYFYDSITVNIQVNKDSTFNVEEKQIFNYIGQYNKGWRSISFNKISAISDIEVIDGQTGIPLIYSSKILEKTDPSSWGKFTYYKQNNAQNIEWYYNLADTSHEWIIKYKVHGGIGFYKDYDEIYWNLFTDYEVLVLRTQAFVKLPENNFSISDFQVQLYGNADLGSHQILSRRDFYFSAENIQPFQPVTIAVGWPKGLIHQSAFWWDFLKIYFGYLVGVLIIFLSIITGIIYWYFSEKHNKGRGTIVPQYEPPKNLRPAMAEIICNERITAKTWPATIVDLAVRGYVKIKEESPSLGAKIGSIFVIISFLAFLFSLLVGS